MSLLTVSPVAERGRLVRDSTRVSVSVALRDVVLAAHGSRDPRAAADTRRLVAAVAAARPDLRVRAAYLDFTAPALGGALHGEFGPTTVVPLLITPAYHARVDVPGVVAAAVDRGLAVAAAPVLGPTGLEDPGLGLLVEALVRRLYDAAASRSTTADWDAVIVGAAGSRDAGALHTVETVASALGVRLGVPCLAGYATGAGRSVIAAAETARAVGARRIAYASLFLAAGVLADRAAAAAHAADARVIAAPLGGAPEISTLVGIRVDATIG
ncbi:MAG TPA: CbiX/SirB N-terminal domain-containing protein [Micromonosporaceae bacterium]|jgi:sirohydrochlorin ferrochelatase|nr:CbiX/SirB N-terminal domain-containing protein [Micromonosporaceae bacterium]